MKTLAVLLASALGVSAFPSAQNMQAYRVGVVPQRVHLGYDGMHINGKPLLVAIIQHLSLDAPRLPIQGHS